MANLYEKIMQRTENKCNISLTTQQYGTNLKKHLCKHPFLQLSFF